MQRNKTMKHWFVLRADASVEIGIGHVMRCLALAEWALDYNLTAVLITRALPKSLEKYVNSIYTKVKLLPKSNNVKNSGNYPHSMWLPVSEQKDAKQTSDIILGEELEMGCPPSFIVVDHYALASPREVKINRFAPILCIDDLSDRPHKCKWLIDQTFNKNKESYSSLINKDTRVFIGATFALLRKEFQKHSEIEKRNFPNKQRNWHVLITLGGVDKLNTSGLILDLLSQTSIFHRMNITTVVGSENPNLKDLRLKRNMHPERIRLMIDVSNMSDLMHESDLCLGAAGSTSWERCAMNLPSLLVVLSDNQQTIAENLDQEGVCVNMGRAKNLNIQVIENGILNIINQPNKYKEMVKKSHTTCDGLGCKRILDTIMR